MKKPCVLLISPGIIKWTDLDFGLPHLVSLGGYLQKHLEVRVEILDLAYEGGDQRQLQRTLEDLGPYLLIGISCYSSFDYMRTLSIAGFIKELYPYVPLVTGGYHASAVPDDMVFDASPFDAVVVGEGERVLKSMVESLLGGQKLEQSIYESELIEDLDELPPYRWDLLNRYWPNAHRLGKRIQLYFSRGCPHHCTFCMERAKSAYRWRAFSAERALDELDRLAAQTDLKQWVINLADPLFGFNPKWRRTVLNGMVERDHQPHHYWALTRAEGLEEEDVELFASANFAIGIGLEAGSHQMLQMMQKTKQPDRYLQSILQLADTSLRHGLNWAANVIVGHPGETEQTFRDTHQFVEELFFRNEKTRGWVSVDPFRLYPGSYVQQNLDQYSQQGTRFHFPRWWSSWYDTAFKAEYIDPSDKLTFERRLELMYQHYGPVVQKVKQRFAAPEHRAALAYNAALDEQIEFLGPAMKQGIERRAAFVKQAANTSPDPVGLSYPLGLQVRDPWIRMREEAVRRLLEEGSLKNEAILEALLTVSPERFLPADTAKAVLLDRPCFNTANGDMADGGSYITLSTLTQILETLAPQPGERVIDLYALSGYMSALLAQLVHQHGRVEALMPGAMDAIKKQAGLLSPYGNVRVVPSQLPWLSHSYDGMVLYAALPRVPWSLLWHLRQTTGRAILFIGPRYKPQDMVCMTRDETSARERFVRKLQVPIVCGSGAWLEFVEGEPGESGSG